MTRKYIVASSAIVPRIVGTLTPDDFVRIAKKIVNKNARVSGVHKFLDE